MAIVLLVLAAIIAGTYFFRWIKTWPTRYSEHEFDLAHNPDMTHGILRDLLGHAVEIELRDKTVYGTVAEVKEADVVLSDAVSATEDGVSQTSATMTVRLNRIRQVTKSRQAA